MTERRLSEELRELWKEIDALAQRQHEARTIGEARESAVFVAEELRELHHALMEVRSVSQALTQAGGDGASVWTQVQEILRDSIPDSLSNPANTILAGGLDLLILVRYTAASVALARERSALMAREIAVRSEV